MSEELHPGRFAAIDIGTVTSRMLVADVVRGQIVPVIKEYAVTNLGEGVDSTHRLSKEAIKRTISAIEAYVHMRDSLSTLIHPVLRTCVMATSASRDAENADEFAAKLAELGLELEVIPGSAEASLSFMGASSAYAGENVMVVDIGGGSTEISIGVGGEAPVFSKSFDIGCRRVTERFLDGYPPSANAIEKAREWIAPQFSEWLEGCKAHAASEGKNVDFADMRMIAVAGTATSVVSMREKMEEYDPDRVNGAKVTLEELEQTTARLASYSMTQLEGIVGLDPRRAPVITAGLIILEEVMKEAGINAYTASESDILEGMIMYNSRQFSQER